MRLPLQYSFLPSPIQLLTFLNLLQLTQITFTWNRHRLGIEILSLSFAGAGHRGPAREEGEEGDGEAKEGSEEGEAF